VHQKPFKRQCTTKPLSEEEIVIEEEASPLNALEKDFPGQKEETYSKRWLPGCPPWPNNICFGWPF